MIAFVLQAKEAQTHTGNKEKESSTFSPVSLHPVSSDAHIPELRSTRAAKRGTTTSDQRKREGEKERCLGVRDNHYLTDRRTHQRKGWRNKDTGMERGSKLQGSALTHHEVDCTLSFMLSLSDGKNARKVLRGITDAHKQIRSRE